MNAKPRLLVFHPAIYQYREDFFNSLSEAFEMRVCLNPPDGGVAFADLSSRLRFTPCFLRRGCNRRLVKGVARELRAFRPDIVMVSEFGLTSLRVLLYRFFHRRRYRVVSLCDDSHAMLTGRGFTRSHARALKMLTPRMDEVILVDRRAADWFREHFGKGLWMPLVRAREPFRSEILAARPLAGKTIAERNLAGKTILLYVGRLEEVKNLEMLLRCYAKARRADTCLVLVGDGSLRQALEKHSDDAPDILFTGWQSGASLYQWFHVSAALVLPSRMEPFGAVVAEALQAGCPALVSRIAGSACLVEESRTFDPSDEDRLTALLSALKTPCDRLLADSPRESLLPVSFEDAIATLVSKLSE